MAFALAVVTLLAGSACAPAHAASAVDLDVAFVDATVGSVRVPAASAQATLARLRGEPGVAVAAPGGRFHAAAGSSKPNDPLLADDRAHDLVGLSEAWARTTGDPSIVVAVVDSGVDLDHPDLAGALVPGVDVVDGDNSPDDQYGHGTEVAGIVAARADNGIGSAGYCPACRVMPVRVLDADGNGSSVEVAQGIRWAVDHGALVINLSLSGDYTAPTLEFVIEAAVRAGVVVVAAAGNQESPSADLRAVRYPAGEPGVVGVAATQADDSLFEWSYRGPWVDTAAPGCHATTAMGGGYDPSFCGTSSSAPAVAGVIGLGLSVSPSVTGEIVTSAIVETGHRGIDTRGGRLDAGRLVTSLAARFAPVTAPERVAGTDFVTTSVAVSRKAWTTAPTVVLAGTDGFADALTGGTLAAKFHGPLLLTDRADLRPEVAAEIARLRAETVVVVGGPAAVAPLVLQRLEAKGLSTFRVGGADRYETSGRVAHSIGFQVGDRVAYAASGSSFADAIAVAGLAAMAHRPLVLVEHDTVSRYVLDSIAGVEHVVVVGGTDAVGPGAVAAFEREGADVVRLAGHDRFETSLAVAAASVERGAAVTKTWMADGDGWQDALVAGPAAAARRAVLLLVDGAGLEGSPPAREWLVANARRSTELVIVGGDGSVSGGVIAELIGAVR